MVRVNRALLKQAEIQREDEPEGYDPEYQEEEPLPTPKVCTFCGSDRVVEIKLNPFGLFEGKEIIDCEWPGEVDLCLGCNRIQGDLLPNPIVEEEEDQEF